jgi:hypothetical protein
MLMMNLLKGKKILILVNDEGRRVGWAYRYRIRRKLDDLKQQQAGKFQCQKKTFILLYSIRRNGNTI